LILDHTKEAGSFGEPLYLDVAATMQEAGENRIVIGGRFGLGFLLTFFFFHFSFFFFFDFLFIGSKDLTGAMGKAVFDNLELSKPKSHFTVGF
jgi:pyruvate-ferredoxin/flavodoxin oxidoreductase